MLAGGRHTGAAAIASAGLVALAAGCGPHKPRQDTDEPYGIYKVRVVKASFPTAQKLAKTSIFRLVVRNVDTRTIPDLAVTVDSFTTRSQQPGLADPNRPVWIVDEGPTGGTTAYANTWALGSVPPGATRTFVWKVTAVQAGTHTVKYRVAAGLNGKARAKVNGQPDFQGSFTVAISGKPAQSRVDPETGKVVRSKS